MSIVHHFSAVSASEEDWGWQVAIGGRALSEGAPYLLVQLSRAPTEQDRQFGHDLPYVEINDQRWSWYGQVKRVALARTELQLSLGALAQAQLGNDGEFVFRFELSPPEHEHLASVLAQIFVGHPAYTEIAA
ncbi:hypothetical protein [Hydrogenophaga sp. RWCD_12]|uniref:hypothetical protein n=1 Tax=Hydrogenophaga sp. RWCD_12 TaxID=3391190 RepID=UPI003984D151